MNGTDLETLLLIGLAFAIGGVLKGATGAGAPVVAIPLLSLLYNVQIAVALFVVPNIVSNLIQLFQYRQCDRQRAFTWGFAVAGILGAGLGTVLLAMLPGKTLMLFVAVVVLVYIIFRLVQPGWRLGWNWAVRLCAPLGVLAGTLQGAAGISAPVSITFLNSMRPDRGQFIATISLFFLAMGLVQLPLQAGFGIMTWERFLQSCIALIPLSVFMPVGASLGKRLSPMVFDRVILGLLGVLSLKIIWDYLS